MTIRRWLGTIAVVAVGLTLIGRGASAWQRWSAMASANVAYEKENAYFNEGRARLARTLMASERFMYEEIRLYPGRANRAAALSAHVRRCGELIESYHNAFGIYSETEHEIIEAREMIQASIRNVSSTEE
jgi:hypothetical protein